MESYRKDVDHVGARNACIDSQIQALKDQAKRSAKTLSEENWEDKQTDREMTEQTITRLKAQRLREPPHPRMFTTNITEERLFQKMAAHGGEYAVLSGEGRPVIDAILGKYSGGGATGDAIYLAGISGDTITRDRVGGEQAPKSYVSTIRASMYA